MRKYLLPENKKCYKANLHSHSTISDGKFTPEELKDLYDKLVLTKEDKKILEKRVDNKKKGLYNKQAL